jgi:hypothetical protein
MVNQDNHHQRPNYNCPKHVKLKLKLTSLNTKSKVEINQSKAEINKSPVYYFTGLLHRAAFQRVSISAF